MKMELPSPVLHSLFALNRAGYEAFVVGGCVRDTLNGKEPLDWDITTSALPEQTQAVFQDYRTIETGIQHGTVTVLVEDLPLEITTYRVDGDYSDGRHPDSVVFTRSLTEDLRRRDFTVNAMAYHPDNGLVDPFHGQEDLKNSIIRCVGTPEKRFTEDALRILRGLRFASTLGFSIEPSTAKAIHNLSQTLSCVSAERIAVEFLKLLCGKNVSSILNTYSDVFSVILTDIDVVKSGNLVSQVINEPVYRLAALLFHCTSITAENTCKQLKLSTRITKSVTTLVENRNIQLIPTKTHVLHALNRLGPELLYGMLSIRNVVDQCDHDAFCALWKRLEKDNELCFNTKHLAVKGTDLITCGIPAGPQIGATLVLLLDAVMDGTCPNQKEKLLELTTKKPVQ